MCGEVKMEKQDRHDGRLHGVYAGMLCDVFSDVVYVCDMFIDNDSMRRAVFTLLSFVL